MTDKKVAGDTDAWDQHWDNFAEAARYNPAQKYRRDLIIKILDFDSLTTPPRILDVGSGQGDFALQLKLSYPKIDYLGLEASQAGIDISRQKVTGAHFIKQDLLRSFKPPEEFNQWATHVVCSEVLEHVDEPEKILTNIKPFLKKGCKLIITVPGGPMSQFEKHIGHRKHYSPGDLHNLFSRCGYKINKITRAGFPFFNFYQLIKIVRGKRLIKDIVGDNSSQVPLIIKILNGLFTLLFSFCFNDSPFGWQMIAIIEKE